MKIKNALLLLLTASIWGVAFVAQSVGMDYVGPFTFNCVRCLMGGVVLLPCIWFFDRKNKKRKQVPAIPGARKTLVMGGICCGVALCLASNFQQFGIQYTTVGKAGFITACYIVIVPVLGLLLGKKCSPVAAGAVVLSLAGLYMLCMNGGELSVNKGDLLMLVCAFLFAVHIMVIDFFSPVVDGVKMSCIQFFVSGILSGGAMLVNETPEMSQIMAAWAPRPLRGHYVLRRGVYPADCGTEGDESNGGFPDTEPGIQYFSFGRMGDFRTEAFVQGSTGLRPHVWRHHTGADSGGTKQGSFPEYRRKLEGPIQKNGKWVSCRILTKGGENIRLPIE